MRACGFCKWLADGVCKKGYIIKPFEKLKGYSRPKQCTKKQDSQAKRRQASDSYLNDMLDKLWSKKIRSRGYCEYCLKRPPEVVLHAHHIYSRRHYATRWDLDNGVCLCTGCHLYKAHKDIQEFSDWVVAHFGSTHIEILRNKANSLFFGYSKEEKLEMIKKMKEGNEYEINGETETDS